ncbi:hypothetical protein [Streptosporangium sp. NPDC006007]|uniref:hypothetical protein n=1 Tax=Streptosporangium sp. NPDC006007 TaxID=3154575 RepID=UPI0033B81AAF
MAVRVRADGGRLRHRGRDWRVASYTARFSMEQQDTEDCPGLTGTWLAVSQPA